MPGQSADIAVLAVQLAGFGRRIEVLGPQRARHPLARIGRELGAQYGDR